jgi:Family of unknown function (DUF5762)
MTESNKEGLNKFVKDDVYCFSSFEDRSYEILYSPKERLVEFIPTRDMSLNEKLNAIVRFSIYLSVLLFVYFSTARAFYVPLFVSLFTYYLWRNSPAMERKGQQGGGAPTECQQPTLENPFMNVLITDYTENPNRPPACDIDLPEVSKDMEAGFNNGLYKDVDDIWGRNNSQRQFYTTASTTIPNDRDSFMKWCYQTPPTCKEGAGERCNRYELGVNHVHGQL